MKLRQRQILLGIAFCLALAFLLARNRELIAYGNTNSSQPHMMMNRSGHDTLERTRVDFVSRRQGSDASVVGDCPQVQGPADVVERQTFQKVSGKTDLFVFSAFLDEPNVVWLIAIGEDKNDVEVFCQLWYRQAPPEDGQGDGSRGQGAGPEMRVMPGTYTALPESHGYRYTAAYIMCALPSLLEFERLYAVSVTRTDCRQSAGEAQEEVVPENVVLVLPPAATPERNFTVCITPLNFRYSRAYELVEMIELNRILGAQLFTFYVHSVGDNVGKILAWYEQQGIVQLVDWKPPVKVDHWPPDMQAHSEIHYFGQLASHNDCLNRHRGASVYLVYVDLDEFIIPKRHYNWTSMMEYLEAKSQSSSAYMFRCQFYRKEWVRNKEKFPGHELATKFRSVVLSTVQREVLSHVDKAKLFIKPESIDVIGVHNVWSYRQSPKTYIVPRELAILNHYRSWNQSKNASRVVRVRDTYMYAYREDLLARLQDVWSQFPDLPLDIDIATYGVV